MAKRKTKKRAVVVCPGRGSYAKAELGYLKRYGSEVAHLVRAIDGERAKLGMPTVTELDSAPQFSLNTHTPGEHASDLIYACSMADFFSIDREQFEIVGVTGNSMGWYTALALAGGLTDGGDFKLIHTMGAMMQSGVIGGQLVYPVVDDNWQPDRDKELSIERALASVPEAAFVSIHFGGYKVIGGTTAAIQILKKELPPVDDIYPLVLVNHAAFHTPLLKKTSARAQKEIGPEWFQRPELPLIDGRGKIWQPFATSPEDIRAYTLGHQVVETYDFSKAIAVALKEFAPDCLILLGPGSGLGGACGQVLIQNDWEGIKSKEDFSKRQKKKPFLLAMGREEQRGLVTG